MIDDRTAIYIHQTHRAFEDLRQIASQLAGHLVLAESGAKSDPSILKAARELHREASETIHTAPVTDKAKEHHHHLLRSLNSLDAALDATTTDAVLPPLKDAYHHLQQASRKLPGFEMVDFKQGCCARTDNQI